MNIVCCIDRNYVMPAGVMITSVCHNNAEVDITFHVVCNPNVRQGDKDDLRAVVDKYGKRIAFYGVDEKLCRDFTVGKEGQPRHITIATYYRLLLPLILPEGIDRVLYLDSDIVVRGDISPLYNADIEDVAVGAVTDTSEGNITMFNRLRYSERLGYFNAGVLLVNLRYWRENNILQECLDFALNYSERVKFHDQDILNYVLRERKRRLPLTYNFQDGFMYNIATISLEKYERELLAAEKNPIVIHYVTTKPWYKKCAHPYKDEFIKYKALTKWSEQRLVPYSVRDIVKILLRLQSTPPYKRLEH